MIDKDLLRAKLPENFYAVGAAVWRLFGTMAWRVSPKGIVSAGRMRRFKDHHKGERCFIIGNGPSLNKMDLGALAGETTFGLNRIYLLFDKMGFSTSYYVCVNRLVINQFAKEIAEIPAPKFISWLGRYDFPFTRDTIFLRAPKGSVARFSTDPSREIWEGATVTFVAMQLAYYMGFSEIILIGVDHHFETQGMPNKTVVSQGADPNHFDPSYFGAGCSWQLPDLEMSELAYRLAKFYFERDGRKIIDATIGGKLEVFPKVDFESVLATGGLAKTRAMAMSLDGD